MARKKGKARTKASAPKATEGNESADKPPEYTSTGDLPPPFPEPGPQFPEPGPHPGDGSSHVAPEADAVNDRSPIIMDDSIVVVDEQGNEIKQYVAVTDDRDGKLVAVVLPNNELRIVLDERHPDGTTFRTRRAKGHEHITVDERPPFGLGPGGYADAEDYAFGILQCFADTPDPPKTRNTSGANAMPWDTHIVYLTGIMNIINAEDSEKGHVFSHGSAGPIVDEIREKILAKSKIWRPGTVIYNSALNEGADKTSIEVLVAAIDKFISNSEPAAFANDHEGSIYAIDDPDITIADIGTMDLCECCPKSSRSRENDNETAAAVSITPTKVSKVEIPHQSYHWVKWVQWYKTPHEPPFEVQGVSEMDEVQRQWEVSEEERKEATKKKKKKKKSKKKKKAVEKVTEGSIPSPTEPPMEESEKASEDHTPPTAEPPLKESEEVSEDHPPPATEPPLEESEKVTEISTPPATELPAEQSEKGIEASTPPPTEPPTDVFEKEDGGSDLLQPPEEQITDFKAPAGSSDAADTGDQSQWLVQTRKRDKRDKSSSKYPTPTENFSPQWRRGSRKRFRGRNTRDRRASQVPELVQDVEQLERPISNPTPDLQSNGKSTVSPLAPIKPPGSAESTHPPSAGGGNVFCADSTLASPQNNPISRSDSGFAGNNVNLKDPEQNISKPSGADEKLDVERQDANTVVIDSGGRVDIENQDTENINGADKISVQAEENTSKEKVSLRIMRARDVRSISGHHPKAGGLRKVYYFSTDAGDLSKKKPPAMTETVHECKINFWATDDTNPSTVPATDDTNPSTVPATNDTNPSTVPATDDTNPSTVPVTDDTNPSTVPATDDTNPSTVPTTNDTHSSLCAYNPSTVPLAITMYPPVDIPPVAICPPTGGSDEAQASLNREIAGKPQPLMTRLESLEVRFEKYEKMVSDCMNNSNMLSHNTRTSPQRPQATDASFMPSEMATGASSMHHEYTDPNASFMHQQYPNASSMHQQYPNASYMHQQYPNASFMHQQYPNSSSMHPYMNQYAAPNSMYQNMSQYAAPNSMNRYTAPNSMQWYTANGASSMHQNTATGAPLMPANTATGASLPANTATGTRLPASAATATPFIPQDITSSSTTIPKDTASDSAARPRNTASTQTQTLRRTQSFSSAQKVD